MFTRLSQCPEDGAKGRTETTLSDQRRCGRERDRGHVVAARRFLVLVGAKQMRRGLGRLRVTEAKAVGCVANSAN
jgi:hypothetical protein